MWNSFRPVSYSFRSTQDVFFESLQVRCLSCKLQRTSAHSLYRPKRKVLSTFQPLVTFYGTVPEKHQPWNLSDSSSPQGLQGDIQDDKTTFKLWLENCHKYGLGNCEKQLIDIQSGKKTIEDVIVEQNNLIADIAQEYQKRNAEGKNASAQGFQDAEIFPDFNMPCPQGVQGEDCARFQMWLENCHQFRFGNCLQQLENYTSGRKTLVQLFEEQDQIIREAATASYQKRALNTLGQAAAATGADGRQSHAETTAKSGEEQGGSASIPMTSRQKLRNAVAVYGSTVMVFHISISLMSLGFFYSLVSSGVDVVGLLGRLGIGESLLQNKLATGTGTFVVAYAVHKVFAPARIAVTLTATPLIVRYLRRIGFLKAPSKK